MLYLVKNEKQNHHYFNPDVTEPHHFSSLVVIPIQINGLAGHTYIATLMSTKQDREITHLELSFHEPLPTK